MKMTYIFFFLGLIYCSPLYAEIKDQNAVFTLMCISEKSTGFNWYKGDWIYAKFKEQKFLIEKITPADGCKLQLDEKNIGYLSKDLKAVGFGYGCYNQRRFGDSFSSSSTKLCSEYWKGTSPNRILQHVTCESASEPIVFVPDGWFHRAGLSNDIRNKPVNDYKDSLTVEVGKCAVISK